MLTIKTKARATYDDAWRAYVRADERVQERIELERACEALNRAWFTLCTPENHAESAQIVDLRAESWESIFDQPFSKKP
jgi:hypothetical protein